MDHQEVANEASKPGVFNLIERIQGRNLPTETVDIYMDEQAAYRRQRLNEAIMSEGDPEKAAALEDELDELTKKVLASKLTFTLQAITNEKNDELVDQAREEFPVEYEDSLNPMTMRKIRTELPSEKREEFYNRLFLAACIVKVSDADGNEDEDITFEKADVLFSAAPLDGIRRVLKLANDMRMVGEWMDQIQNADF